MSSNKPLPKLEPNGPLPPKKRNINSTNQPTAPKAELPQPTPPRSYQFMPPRTQAQQTPMPSQRVTPTAQNPVRGAVKASQPDTFLELIQGPTLTLIIGLPPTQRTYTVPSALLSDHSFFFKKELARVLVQCLSKKRKLRFFDDEDEDASDVMPAGDPKVVKTLDGKNSAKTPDGKNEKEDGVKKVDGKDVKENGVNKVDDSNENSDGVETLNMKTPSIKPGTDTAVGNYTPWTREFTSSAILKLPDIDPAIFGLFLKFIYQGSYPPSVDAGRVPYTQPQPSTLSMAQGPLAANMEGNVSQYSPYLPLPTPKPSAPINPQPIHTTAPLPHSLPTIPTHNLQSIPPSISAYLLATRLQASSFTNHALTRIYGGIGVFFVLTPYLIDYVWNQTKFSTTQLSLASLYSSSTTSGNLNGNSTNGATQNGTSTTTPSTPLNPCALRCLLLDVLTIHWPSTSSGHIIARSAPLNYEWNRVFDAHDDLRRDFILGLQGGNGRVGAVQAYFVSYSGGNGGSGNAGNQNGQVVVKKEGA